MLILYAITIFLGAALLFLVEPMVAKMVLPMLGGSPAVWNTCMVFFQASLLGGYLGAHLLGKARARTQVVVYALALAAPIAVSLGLHRSIVDLPRGWAPPEAGAPVPWLLTLLAAMVGLPFLVISAAAPLLQRWFSLTGHRAAKDPYFLYAASNAGSMLALLGYPALVEPGLTLGDQRRVWSVAFGIFAIGAVACGAAFQRSAAGRATVAAAVAPTAAPDEHPWRRRLWWVFLAFVPSSLVLGTTQFLSTDIAAVPLLWVIPLAVYLLTFIIAFSGRADGVIPSLCKILPILAVGLAVAFLVQARRPIWVLVVLHVVTLFMAALLCHARLAKDKPDPSRLTEFYLLVSVGGVLGGVFNALVAPLIFTGIIEYPIAIGLALLVRPAPAWAWWDRVPRAAGILLEVAAALLILSTVIGLESLVDRIAAFLNGHGLNVGYPNGAARMALSIGIPAAACYLTVRRPRAFAMSAGLILAFAAHRWGAEGRPLYAARTFFGVYHVNRVPPMTLLVHGTTVHGLQSSEAGMERTPLGYYHPEGPIGQVFKAFKDVSGADGRPLFEHVGLVGLGTGALAAYGEPGRRITFHEIDPAVVRIAENPAYFSYLRDGKAKYDITLGDGRLTLAKVPDGEYGLILLDAFSSDSIPIHLVTREAVELYLTKLKPGGIIAFHISNQYLDLAPVLIRIADELHLSLIAQKDDATQEEQEKTGRFGSNWVLLARERPSFRSLLTSGRWRSAKATQAAPLWTDDFSNILSIFEWD